MKASNAALMSFIFYVLGCTSPAPFIHEFEVSPRSLPAEGGEVTVRWRTEHAQQVTLSPQGGRVSTSGSMAIHVREPVDIILEARGADGSLVHQRALVSLEPAPPQSVSLKVVNLEGAPQVGSTVYVADQSAVADADGLVRFEGVVPPYTVAVRHTDYRRPVFVFAGLRSEDARLTLWEMGGLKAHPARVELSGEHARPSGANETVVAHGVSRWSSPFDLVDGETQSATLPVLGSPGSDSIEFMGMRLENAWGADVPRLSAFGTSGPVPAGTTSAQVELHPVESAVIPLQVRAPAGSDLVFLRLVAASVTGGNADIGNAFRFGASGSVEIPKLPNNDVYIVATAAFPHPEASDIRRSLAALRVDPEAGSHELVFEELPTQLSPPAGRLTATSGISWTGASPDGRLCVVKLSTRDDGPYLSFVIATSSNTVDLGRLPSELLPFDGRRRCAWDVQCLSGTSMEAVTGPTSQWTQLKYETLRSTLVSTNPVSCVF